MTPAHHNNMLRWLFASALVCGLASSFRLPSVLRQMQISHSNQFQKEVDKTGQHQSYSEHVHPRHGNVVGNNQDHIPGIEIAARQFLFNYATQQGIDILKDRISQLEIPAVSKSFNLPLVGEFTLQLSELKVVSFNASSDEARLSILDGHFELWITQVEANLTFKWHWEKLGMSGTGTGELDLKGGSIDYRFRVVTTEASRPSIAFDDVSSRFTSVDLTIKSFSSDWLYQAVMSLFNEQIQKAVQNGIANALQNDVPENLNKILDTLPTKLDIKGLPFSTAFEYSIFTLTYVLVKGYGEVEAESSASKLAAALRAASSSACPYIATPLPLSSEDIASDSHMTSIYLHESVLNCMMWGLFNSNTMRYTLQDGTIPKLHLTTDLLAMLIPALPKAYPHQFLKIDAEATGMPKISFSFDKGTTVQALYRVSIFVANETEGNPKIATLSANLTITGQVNYDSTIISGVEVHHTVEESAMAINPAMWDNTVSWFIQNYAGLYPLQFLITHFIQTPVTSLVSLVNAVSSTYDGWYGISGDVQLHPSRRLLLNIPAA